MARRPATPEQVAAQVVVGDRIRELRRGADLTQEALADAADLHPVFVSRLEGGRANPSLGTLLSIAGALDVTVGELIADL